MEKTHKLYFGASKGISLISTLIKWMQWGDKHTHVFYIPNFKQSELSNPTVIEAWHEPILKGGAVRKGKFYDVHTENTKFDIFHIEVTEKQYNDFNLYIESKIGNKYDFMGILGFIIKSDIQNKNKSFCSELIFDSLQHIGINLLNYTKPYKVKPSLLIKSPLLKVFKPTIRTNRYARNIKNGK